MMKHLLPIFFLLILFGCNPEKDASKLIDSAPDGSAAFICPAGYGLVPAYPSAGVTSDFCVMQYEAANVNNRPTSSSTLAPWTSVSTAQAKSSCQSLNSSSYPGRFDLISNQEWMALAYQIEAHGANWSSGVVGTGCLMRGTVSAWDNNVCIFNNAGDIAIGNDRPRQAELALPNGSKFFDLSGNVYELVDLILAEDDRPYSSGDGAVTSSERELSAINTRTSSLTGGFLPATPALTSANGAGVYIGGTNFGPSFEYQVLRGGVSYGSGGLFHLRLDRYDTDANSDTGFRCVYRRN